LSHLCRRGVVGRTWRRQTVTIPSGFRDAKHGREKRSEVFQCISNLSVGQAGSKQDALLSSMVSFLFCGGGTAREHTRHAQTGGTAGKKGQQTNAGTEQQHPGTCISRQALACQSRTELEGALLGRMESFARPLEDSANASRILYRVFYKEQGTWCRQETPGNMRIALAIGRPLAPRTPPSWEH
jgi:hypothetical protein